MNELAKVNDLAKVALILQVVILCLLLWIVILQARTWRIQRRINEQFNERLRRAEAATGGARPVIDLRFVPLDLNAFPGGARPPAKRRASTVFSSKKFGVEIQLEEGDDVQAAFDRARAEVQKANQREAREGAQARANQAAAGGVTEP